VFSLGRSPSGQDPKNNQPNPTKTTKTTKTTKLDLLRGKTDPATEGEKASAKNVFFQVLASLRDDLVSPFTDPVYDRRPCDTGVSYRFPDDPYAAGNGYQRGANSFYTEEGYLPLKAPPKAAKKTCEQKAQEAVDKEIDQLKLKVDDAIKQSNENSINMLIKYIERQQGLKGQAHVAVPEIEASPFTVDQENRLIELIEQLKYKLCQMSS
jgi:hypothetical protein